MKEDQELKRIEKRPGLFRKKALVLEGVPIVLALLFLLIDQKLLFFYSILALICIYLFGSWYLFRSGDYKWYNTVLSVIVGVFLMASLMGILFHVLNWEGSQEMLMSGFSAAIYGAIISLIVAIYRTLSPTKRLYKFRMSWKIFLRFLILAILYFATELKDPFFEAATGMGYM